MKLHCKTIKHYKQTDRPFKKVIIFRFRDTQTLHHNIYIYIIIITIPGGYEMTDTDVLKLQKMYGCDGACGGYAKSEGGGFSNKITFSIFSTILSVSYVCIITGKLEGKNSDRESPCEWILETSPGKVEKENYFDQFAFFFLRNILNTPQGIEIAISELTGPTDCSTDYLEVEQNFQLLVIFSPSNTHTPTHIDKHRQTKSLTLTLRPSKLLR